MGGGGGGCSAQVVLLLSGMDVIIVVWINKARIIALHLLASALATVQACGAGLSYYSNRYHL